MKSIQDIALSMASSRETVYDRLCAMQEMAQVDKKSIWGAVIDGQIYDLYCDFPTHGTVDKWITADDEAALILLRHSCAHLLAEAVQCLYPETKLATGPVIKNGFYYDLHRQEPFTEKELVAIENKMHELVKKAKPIERHIVDGNKLREWYSSQQELYKLEILETLLSQQNKIITVYSQGNWFDMCRGPHVPHTKCVGSAFKLLHISGSYWRGDSRNPMLQRIYGTCWFSKGKLKHYLNLQENAKKHDHCLLARTMNLFHIDPKNPGMVFWHADGWTLYQNIKNYIRRRLRNDYQEVNTPVMLSEELWDKSGHLDKFSNNMYFIPQDNNKSFTIDSCKTCEQSNPNQPLRQNLPFFVLKPMNCPAHVQIFNRYVTSYKQLPVRLSEFGSCFRCEPSGALRGIMRLRSFVQDDGHIFCTMPQVKNEIKKFCQLVINVYRDFGFKIEVVNFSDRPKNRIGEDNIWDQAEEILQQVLQELSLPFVRNKGEGAFYGPKLEFCLLDAMERMWQCGTIQLDFNLPQRLNACFIDNQGIKQSPVMLHRAILGSIERFLGILLEHYFGFLPAWLAPQQVAVLTVSEKDYKYGQDLVRDMQKLHIRVILDDSNEKLSYKIRKHTVNRVSFLCIIGTEEVRDNNITIRWTKLQKLVKIDRVAGLRLLTAECASPVH